MGLFKKKKKTVSNQIDNRELKQNLADSALALLINQKQITMEDMAGIKAEFGYLMKIENHGLEGLFRIIKDSDVYYFAAQQGKLMLVAISEEQYLSTISYMLKQHMGEEIVEFRSIYLDKDTKEES